MFKQLMSSKITFNTQPIQVQNVERIDPESCRGQSLVIFTSRLSRFYASLLHQCERR